MLIISLIVFELVIFAVLIMLLRRIMTNNVMMATKHLDELNQDYTNKELQANKLLEEAKRKSQEIIEGAEVEAERMRQQIIKEAESQKDILLSSSRQQGEELMHQAERSRQQLLSEIDKRVAEQAVDEACSLIQHTLPLKFKQEAHTQWVEDLINGGFSELTSLSLPKDANQIKILSAFALTEGQKRELSKKIKEAFGEKSVFIEEVDPGIVVGLVISVGSLVLDGSLRNKIQEQAKSAKFSKV